MRVLMGARVADGEVAVGHAVARVDEHGRLSERNLLEAVRAVARDLITGAQSEAPGRLAA